MQMLNKEGITSFFTLETQKALLGFGFLFPQDNFLRTTAAESKSYLLI